MAATVDGGDRSTRGGWRSARVVILVAVVVVGGLVLGYAFLRDTLQSSKAKAALEDYLEDVSRGDYDRAYDRLCGRVLTGYTEADHEAFLKTQPAFDSYDLDNPTTSTSGETTEITYSVHFATSAGAASVVRMAVDMQADGAKVCDGPRARIRS